MTKPPTTDEVLAIIDEKIKGLYLLKGAIEQFKEAQDAGMKKLAGERLQTVYALMVHLSPK